MKLLIAFGTDDGKKIKKNGHFGMSKYFYVYEFFNREEFFAERRENVKFKGDESIKSGDPAKARATASVLENIDVVVSASFGPNITRLLRKFVCIVVRTESIKESIKIIHANIDKIINEKNKGEKRKHIILRPLEK